MFIYASETKGPRPSLQVVNCTPPACTNALRVMDCADSEAADAASRDAVRTFDIN